MTIINKIIDIIPLKDKGAHFFVCMFIAMVFAFILLLFRSKPSCCCIVAFLASLCVGMAKEYGDMNAPGNHWDWWDILADAIGALVGCTLGLLALIGKS